jgi:peptidoglycan hydrolase-like protein with peptidoglycan-binding domain
VHARIKRLIVVPAMAAGIAVGILAGVMPSASASTTAPYIHEGSRGTGVVCVQLTVNDELAAEPQFHVDVDGIFGPKTLAAVKEFQRWERFTVDGVVGRQTGSYMALLDTNNFGLPGCINYLPTY